MRTLSLTLLAGILLCNAQAQTPNLSKVIVVNSGLFEFAPPYADYVTVGAFSPSGNAYHTFDTIYNQSAQSVLVEGTSLYVASEDSILEYDLTTELRKGAAPFDSVLGYSSFYSALSMVADDDFLYVGNWYGATNNNIQVYERFNHSYLGAINGVDQGVKSMVIIGDTLYASQNETGVNYQDTMGSIAVIDLVSQTHVYDINVGFNGTDIGLLATDGSKVYAFNKESNTVVVYDPSNSSLTSQAFPGTLYYGSSGSPLQTKNGEVYLTTGNGISKYNMAAHQVVDLLNTAHVGFAYDEVGDQFFTSSTDFFSYGRLNHYSGIGAAIDSFEVGISPEGVALYYEGFVGMPELPETNEISMWPNPGSSELNVLCNLKDANYSVYDMTGKLMARGTILNKISIPTYDWPTGLYQVVVENKNQRSHSRWIKG